MTNGDHAMELLAALGGFEVVRPEMQESTALGSARRCSLRPLLACLDGTLREARDVRARQYGAQHAVCAAYNAAGVK